MRTFAEVVLGLATGRRNTADGSRRVGRRRSLMARRRIEFEPLEMRLLLAGSITQVRYFDTYPAGIVKSTDPADLTYHPPSGHLYLVDSEIEEIPDIFDGNNIFEISLKGDQLFRGIISTNTEPTGITYNAFDGYFYVTNDDKKTITRYDNNLNRALATVSTLDAAPNALDPEGITSDPATGFLYVTDGFDGGRQVLVYDSQLRFRSKFAANEVLDGEGIAFDPVTQHLFLSSKADGAIIEYSLSGSFIRRHDLSRFSPEPVNPSGLAFAPTSDPNDDPQKLALYISDRMLDNDLHPDERDGRVYEALLNVSALPTADIRVAGSSDDAEEDSKGSMKLTDTRLDLGANQTVGLRFKGVNLPQGVTIVSAYVQFKADEKGSEPASLTIRGQASDSASPFTSSSKNLSSRPKTTASVAWSPPSWTKGQAGPDQRTAELASVIQEIVNRPGWSAGANLALMITGSGRRFAMSYDRSPSSAPLLHVEYIIVNQPPVNTVPGAQATYEDTNLVFGSGNQISIADADAGTNPVEVTVSVTNGTLTLAGVTGLTFTAGTGTADPSMTFSGTIANINAALNGMAYTPTFNYIGSAALTITTNDLGNTGSDGFKKDIDTVAITVNAVNDAPSFIKGPDQTLNEDAAAQTIVGWATAMSPGPNDESAQLLDFIVNNDSNSLFSVQPNITAFGTLKYTPAADAYGTATVTVRLHDDGGTANGGVNISPVQTFTITLAAVNDAPSFTKGANQNVNEDAGPQTIAAWATAITPGPNEAAQSLTFQVISNSNPSLFAAGPAISPDGTLSYTPAPNANGAATIFVVLKDDGGTANGGVDTSVSRNFTVTVNAVNDAPSFNKGADPTVNEDAGAQSVAGWASNISSGPNESGQVLTFQVVSDSNPGLFAVLPAISSDGTLTYTPAANAYGSANIAVVLKDNGGTGSGGVDTSAPQSFVITVNPVNDAPSFTKGANLTVNEDAGPQAVVGWATAMSAGPNESGQTLTFLMTANSSAALFAAAPAISPDGTLSYTPAANANGSATVTFVLKDDGGTANGGADTSTARNVVITVEAINDAPSFTKGADQTVTGDTAAQTVAGWASNISAGPNEAGQGLTFMVTGNSNPGLFAVGPATSPDGTLTYTAAASVNGSATITLVLKDNGRTANGGVDTSAPQSFVITVNAVNQAPSFTKGPDQTVNEDAGSQTVAGWATAISPGPAGEAGQVLNFIVSNDSNALFAVQPTVSSFGTLKYTPAVNANGTAIVTVQLHDNGGTANGGVDTSPPQSFTITVSAVNDLPSFTLGPNPTANEDAGTQTLAGFASNISAGPNESGQALTFQVTGNTNPGLFSVGPAISSGGTLSYTPAANANDSATISVVLKDDGGTANGGVDTSAAQSFVITVNAVNDVPSFTKGPDQTVHNSGAQTVAGWASNISAGPANESGQSLTFLVNANSNPLLFSVAPAISSDGTLTYTPAVAANGSATIDIVLEDDGGTANGGVDTSAAQSFVISVSSANIAPSFTKGPDQTVNEDAGARTVTGWATNISPGPNESGQTVTFQVTGNSNPDLFTAGPAISSAGTLTYTPVANANGSATITVVLTDDGGTDDGGVDTSVPQSFVINVNAVNDAPSFTKGSKRTVNEDSGPKTVVSWATNISAGPANESGQGLTFEVSANGESDLFAAGPSISPNGTLTFTPAPDAYGSATVTVVLRDDGGTANGGVDASAPKTFLIIINPINDAPTFSISGDQTVNEDSGPQSVADWATDISAGPDESDQTPAFQVTGDSNPGLFSVAPAISSDGTLSYTPAADAYGLATITIVLHDNGGTVSGGLDTSAPRSFVITVNSVNDAPSFTRGADQTVNEDAGPQTVAGWASNMSVGPANESGQSVMFQITDNTNPSLFAADPAVASDGTLTYTPAPDANGSATITVVVTDSGGTASGGVDTSSAQSFVITVNAINDRPSFTKGADQTVGDDAGAQSVAGWASDISPGPNESGQSVTFQVTGNSNEGLFAVGLAISPDGTLTYTPAAGANGSATITIELKDDGGTADGGLDTSAAASFVVTVVVLNHAPVVEDESYAVNENIANGAVVGTAEAHDADAGDTLSYAITAGDTGGAFAIDSMTGQITVANSALLDFETTPSFSLTVTVSDNGSPSRSGTGTITIVLTDVNEAPVLNDQVFAVDENSADGTLVGMVAASDQDSGQTLSYAITAGNTNGAFAIDSGTGQITVANPGAPGLDFETTPSFSLTVEVSDDGSPSLSDTATITIALGAVNEAAPVVDDQGFTVDENSTAGTVVGTVAASDADAGETLSYAITVGDPGGVFAINPATGEITVANPGASGLDFETAASFSLTVEVSDSGSPSLSDTATITIALNDLNDAPVVGDQSFAVDENSLDGTVVGTLMASDPDAGQSLSYAITSGNTDGAFAIDSATGLITVANSAALDFEATSSFSLTVEVSDNGSPSLFDTATITIALGDVNETPPVADDASYSLGENSANGTVVGTVPSSDADAGETLSYAITGGNTGGAFAINSATGLIAVANGAALDFETTPSFTLTVEVSDNGTPSLSDTAAITISLNDVNDVPVMNDQGFSLDENSTAGTVVGTVAASDADAGETLSYSITGGDPGGVFAINPATGEITVANPGAPGLDFEMAASFSLTVEVSDSGSPNLSDTATITIALNDLNDAPAVGDLSLAVDENSLDGTVVGIVMASDPDTGQSLSYAIIGGNTGGAFALDSATGLITVANSPALDFEARSSFSLTVEVSDNGSPSLFDTATITIALGDVNETPPVADDASYSLGENSANGTVVGTVPSSDADAGETLSYAITGGNTGGAFAINSATGLIAVANGAALDFETTPSFTLTVEVSDNGTPSLSDTAAITINLNDVNDAPVMNDQGYAVDENSANGTVVGTVSASDQDAGETLSYAITAGNTGGAFAVNSATGQISVANSDMLDFEITPSFSLTVTVSDNGSPSLSGTATITVGLNDANDAPVVTNQSFNVNENIVNGTVVGTVVASDQDAGQTLSFAIAGGNTAGAFAIDSATGQITVANSAALDFEATPSFSLTVEVADNGNPQLSDSAVITIALNDINEPPMAADDGYSADQGATLNVAAQGVLANDTDPENNSLTAVLVSGPSHGTLTLHADGSFAYHHDGSATTSDSFTYKANDGTSDSAAATVDITVHLSVPVTLSFQDGVYPDTNYAGTRDTKINAVDMNKNSGTSTTLSADADPLYASLLKWDLSAIASGSTVQSVTLTLHVNDSTTQFFEIYELKRDWAENSATWNVASTGTNWESGGAQGASDRGSVVLGTVTGASGVKSFTLNANGIAVVQSWVNNDASNRGIIIQNYSSSTNSIGFYSRETLTATSRPMLSVTYVAASSGGGLTAAGSRSSTGAEASGTDPNSQLPISSAERLQSGVRLVSIDDESGLGAEQRTRVRDAITTLNGTLEAFGVVLMEVDAPTRRGASIDIRLHTGSTSVCGTAAAGVLGCATHSGDITLIEGWNWYTGTDPATVGRNQYDFQTIVTHELGHALGLEHSADANSVMYAALATGEARRTLSAHDLALITGSVDGEHEAPHTVRAALPNSPNALGRPENHRPAITDQLDPLIGLGRTGDWIQQVQQIAVSSGLGLRIVDRRSAASHYDVVPGGGRDEVLVGDVRCDLILAGRVPAQPTGILAGIAGARHVSCDELDAALEQVLAERSDPLRQ